MSIDVTNVNFASEQSATEETNVELNQVTFEMFRTFERSNFEHYEIKSSTDKRQLGKISSSGRFSS